MVPMPGKSIEHFTHPGHLLVEETCSETHYLCDGCKTPGQGTRYRCSNTGCDFVLHTFCGTCSPGNESGGLISSFMHPQHPLNLVLRKAHGKCLNKRICNVCGEEVEGLFYRCKDCDFDLHPLCTQLPQYLNHPLHQLHSLKLESYSSLESAPGSSQCVVCRGACTSWRYGCQSCGFGIHLECILAPCGDINILPTHRSPIPAGGPPPPTPDLPPPYNTSANYNYGPYGTNYNLHNLYNHANQVQGSGAAPPLYPPPPYSASANYNYGPYNYSPYGTNYSPHNIYGTNYSPHNIYNHANQAQGGSATHPSYPPPPYDTSANYNYAPYGTNYNPYNIYNHANQAQGSGATPPSYPPPPYDTSANYNCGPYGTNFSPHNIYNHGNQAQGSGTTSGSFTRLGKLMFLLVQRLATGVLIFNSPDIISSVLG